MMRTKLLAVLLSASALAACSTAPRPDGPVLRGSVASDPGWGGGRSAYGQFLAGQAALQGGANQQAAGYFNEARELDEDPGVLADRAFTASLLAGDVQRAAAIAPRGPDSNEAVRRLAVLTRVVDLLADGKGKDAEALLKSDPPGFPHRPVSALLGPWLAAAAGDAEGAIVRPELQGDRFVQYFGQLGQARLFERAKRYDEAETDYKALMALDAGRGVFLADYGAFLERRKRHDEAVALYDSGLARDPDDATLLTARARAAARGPAPAMLTYRQGAAHVLLICAASFATERQSQFSLAYLRLALRLDPKRDDAWLLVGDLLAQDDDVTGAREAYAKTPVGSQQYVTAQMKLAWSYQSGGDKPRALAIAQKVAADAPRDRDAQIGYADILRANEQWQQSATVLDGLIAAQGDKPDWRLLYMRGMALERANRWPDAERDLTTALKLNPDEPDLLNYLGYSWIDRGERLPEAIAMVQKAVDAKPQSGAMLDSLGWGYYRQGDYKTAVAKLEQAVELEPGDPDINGHLGDAYWRVGRQVEARYQWQRVLSLEPDDKQRAEAESKLKNGLGPLPARVAQSAG
ncbi:MAG: tetratricopeptide repeat protein [Caulobacter sp.]|nr:tetratricopeptide repeat protein [Caulobacter sp.]